MDSGPAPKGAHPEMTRLLAFPGRSRSTPFFTAWCAAEPGPYKARCPLRSRFSEAALREELRAASRPGNATKWMWLDPGSETSPRPGMTAAAALIRAKWLRIRLVEGSFSG